MGSFSTRTAQRIVTAVALTTSWLAGANAQPLPSLAPMIERVSPAVVNISVSGRVGVSNPLLDDPFFRQFLPRERAERPFQSAGSGVIVDGAEGFILTNHHVVANADRITVTLFDNRGASATVIGTDEASDLAVLKIDTSGLTEIALGDSTSLRVGDFVVAIGNPFGFSHTVTSGIVSGLGRALNPGNSTVYEDFIQTDASINPGNSGGALVNLDGELIGINSAILSRSGGNIGIGFAIPVAMARNVLEQIVEFGEVRRGLLGVSIRSVDSALVEQYGLPAPTGAYVTEVAPGSAAAAAGLRIEDVIVSVDGRPVGDSSALRNAIGLMRPGDSVEIGYVRNGSLQSTVAELGAQDSATFSSREPTPARDSGADLEPAFAGVVLVPETAADGLAGLLVREIDAASDAADLGLRRGDLITHLNRRRVTSLDDARAVVRESRGVIARVRRGDRDLIVQLP